MQHKHLTVLLLSNAVIGILSIGCNSKPSASNKTIKTKLEEIDVTDQSFYSFIEKFSIDTQFQFNRTQYPLMLIEPSDEIADHFDTFYHANHWALRGTFDFRNNKTTDETQEIRIDHDELSATIIVSGIDCGISVYYHFKKIKGLWMLTHIEDWST